MVTTTQLIESRERIRLEGGAELFLDSRGLDAPAGWRHCASADARSSSIDLWEVFALCGPALARHVTTLTVGLICELHERCLGDESDEAWIAAHRLTRELAGAVHRMARASDG